MHICLCPVRSLFPDLHPDLYGLCQTGEQTYDHGQGESIHSKIMLPVIF